MWALGISSFLLFRVFLLSVKATWSLSSLHKVHMLVWFVLDFTVLTIFHSIEYFTLLLFKSHDWFASWVKFLGLLLKGLGKGLLCSLYLDLTVLLGKPMRNELITQCPHYLNEYL